MEPVPVAEYIDTIWQQQKAGRITPQDMVELQAVFLRTMEPIPLPQPAAHLCRRCHVRPWKIQRLCKTCWHYERVILAKTPEETQRRAMVRGWRG